MLSFKAFKKSGKKVEAGKNGIVSKEKVVESQELKKQLSAVYEKALSLQLEGQYKAAIKYYKKILLSELHASSRLKKLVYSNLSDCYKARNNLQKSIIYCIEAVSLDRADVVLWDRIAKHALELKNMPLARQASESALSVAPTYWPCLDRYSKILFAISDFTSLSRVLELAFAVNPAYPFGLKILEYLNSPRKADFYLF
ncbi:calcineurin-binding protein cabin-1-like [Zophobas morio]|uniref:calcineurin-binding protein cabin-1-like n=1 Tax=Zophobas morio TaxID=2755281 RepID=UPI0030826E21